MITLTNNCSLGTDEKITKILKNFVYNYNKEEGTKYTLNDIKEIRVRENCLSFGFNVNFWITISYDEIQLYCE